MSRGSLDPRIACGVSLLTVLAALTAYAVPARAADSASSSPAALHARAATLFERRERSTRAGGVDVDALRGDLIALAGQLEAARMDSLAADARIQAARVLVRLGRSSEAEQQLQSSIANALRARDPKREMRARLLLIDVREPADPEFALRAIDQSLPAVRALGDDDLLGDAFATQTRALSDLGQFDEALIAGRRAAAHFAVAGDLHQQLLQLSQCSQALRFLARHAEARAITDSVIALARAHQEGLPLSRALTESASLYRTQHRHAEALAALDEAIDLDRRRGDLQHWRNSRIARARLFLSMGKPSECAADLDTLLASPDVQRSLTTLVRAAALRARALVGLGRAVEADTLLAGVSARYERYRSGLANEEEMAGSGEHATEMYMAWTRVKLALNRPDLAWQASERGRGAALETRLGAVAVPPLADLQARLARTRSAMLQYDSVDPLAGNVILVSGSGVRGFPMKVPMTIGDLKAVTDGLSAPVATPPPDSAAARLAQTLLADVQASLDKGLERIIVIPPTRLEALPFEALPLPGARPAATLGERFPVTYVASAGVWMALDRRAAPAMGITVVADPAVSASHDAIASLEPTLRDAVLRPLPGARQEARLLDEPGATMLLGRDATLSRLLASPPSAVLHIATHAFDDPKSAARGGLVLSGNEPMLTPARLETLTVKADLVTLSGCGTLGSTAYSGEGTFGLARAFLASGSRSVVSTRWNVSDKGAARFMESFYGALRSGLARDESLRRGRDQLRKEGYPPRDCWAFMLTGVGDQPVAMWAARGKSDPVRK